ncbi:hypothetical protein [Hwanghaeella sp.]|uniref:hypothetical protein n=1 Tax=Hwanghaeella sp. TaxID=2605943 RepID=UPI003CCBA52A
MNLAISAGFLTATVLLYSWARLAFNSENSTFKQSSMAETIAVATCVALTGLIALTLAFAITAGIGFKQTIADLTLVHLGAIAICAVICWFVPRLISKRAHAASDNPTGSAPEGAVSSFPGKGRGKKPAGSRPDKYRKAA